MRAGAEVDDEVDIAALRVEGVAGGRAEYVQAQHAEPAAEPADFIAVRFDDAVHGRLAGKLCRRRWKLLDANTLFSAAKSDGAVRVLLRPRLISRNMRQSRL